MLELLKTLSEQEYFVKTVAPIFLLGFLIFIHESGHFLTAKLFGVGVEKFSFGFGPRIFGVNVRGTEYLLSWIPLGGYVKMVGDDPFDEQLNELRDDSFLGKPAWKRLLISFAGPLFNLLLPVGLFAGLYLVGAPQSTSWVGIVVPDSAAAAAGLRPGDRITAVDGREITFQLELQEILREVPPGATISLQIEREGQTLTLPVTLRSQVMLDQWGDAATRNVLGVAPYSAVPEYAVLQVSGGAAFEAGLQSGDRIVRLNGQELRWGYEADLRFREAQGAPLELEVLRGTETLTVTLTATPYVVPGTGPLSGLGRETLVQQHPAALYGLMPLELTIAELMPDKPAIRAGLERGDLLVAINGQPLASWQDIKRGIGERPEELKAIDVIRNGQLKRIEVQPDVITGRQVDGTEVKEGQVGLSPPRYQVPDTLPMRLPVAEALWRGASESLELTGAFVQVLGRIVMGKIPLQDALGGPISIVSIAAKSAWAGIFDFIRVMALVSISLGLLNLLPIPLLDGGHILFFTLEMIKGSPVSMRVREISQSVGMLLLLVLMAFALANDVRMEFLR